MTHVTGYVHLDTYHLFASTQTLARQKTQTESPKHSFLYIHTVVSLRMPTEYGQVDALNCEKLAATATVSGAAGKVMRDHWSAHAP